MVNSKTKGSTAEREVAKIMTEATGYEWKRVPASGALFHSGHTEFHGDVYSDTNKDYEIEVKHHKEKFSFVDIFNSKGKIMKWWAKLIIECGDKQPMLWVKICGKWTLFTKLSLIDLKQLNIYPTQCFIGMFNLQESNINYEEKTIRIFYFGSLKEALRLVKKNE